MEIDRITDRIIGSALMVHITYNGIQTNYGYRVDLLVERAVVVEIKAVARIELIHEAQLNT